MGTPGLPEKLQAHSGLLEAARTTHPGRRLMVQPLGSAAHTTLPSASQTFTCDSSSSPCTGQQQVKWHPAISSQLQAPRAQHLAGPAHIVLALCLKHAGLSGPEGKWQRSPSCGQTSGPHCTISSVLCGVLGSWLQLMMLATTKVRAPGHAKKKVLLQNPHTVQ